MWMVWRYARGDSASLVGCRAASIIEGSFVRDSVPHRKSDRLPGCSGRLSSLSPTLWLRSVHDSRGDSMCCPLRQQVQ